MSLVAATFLAVAPCAVRAATTPRFSARIGLAVGKVPFRLVAADLNGDLTLDLATVDLKSSTVSVLFGRGDGNFRKRIAYRTARHPTGITAADINGDSNPDLVTASDDHAGSMSVFLNVGAGRFGRAGSYPTGAGESAVAAADINGDGIVDVLKARYNRRDFVVLLGVGAGRFLIAHRYTGSRAYDVAIGEFNGDGKPDVALTTAGRYAVAVRLGNGDGSFGTARGYKGTSPVGIRLADFNHDYKLDIATDGADVFLGNGDGTFGAGSHYDLGSFDTDAVVAADFDRDGNLDIAGPDMFGPVERRGRGDGTFRAKLELAVDEGTMGGAVGDFNGDGWPDLAFNGTCGEEVFSGCDGSWVDIFLNWTGQPAPPCVVPSIAASRWGSWTLRRASRLIRSYGCRLGHVRQRYSRTVPKGNVISQRPSSDTVLPSHSRVNVVVSSGRRR